MAAPQEIELKLELSAEDADALFASGLLGKDGREAQLHAVYFDTPEQALRVAGLSLRIREADGQRVQTVKAAGAAAGLFTRDEWEAEVEGDRPVPDPRTPLGPVLDERYDALLPLFEVPVGRTVFQRKGIEIALDRGEIVAGERREPICELELELKGGDAKTLFAFAREIDAVAPARIGVFAKADRGYRLLAERPLAVQAGKLRLDPNISPVEAFSAIVHDCLRQYRLNEDILLDQPGAEAVHQARVALRRLRSAMVVFKPVIGSGRRKLSERIRDLARVLGEARDLDVLCAEVAPGPLLDCLTAARDGAYARMARKLRARRTRRLPLDLIEWTETGVWRSDPATARLRETPLAVFAAQALDRLRHRLRKDGRHLAQLSTDDRHQVRKDAKKLRYGIEFLAALFAAEKKRRKAFVKALKALQEALGALNDRVAAEEHLIALKLDQMPEARAFLAEREADFDALLEEAAKARHALLEIAPFWDEPARREL